ncbi:unnamed protein product, partial [Phaeothamnion confervicola]
MRPRDPEEACGRCERMRTRSDARIDVLQGNPHEPEAARSKRWLWAAGSAIIFLAGMEAGASLGYSSASIKVDSVDGTSPTTRVDGHRSLPGSTSGAGGGREALAIEPTLSLNLATAGFPGSPGGESAKERAPVTSEEDAGGDDDGGSIDEALDGTDGGGGSGGTEGLNGLRKAQWAKAEDVMQRLKDGENGPKIVHRRELLETYIKWHTDRGLAPTLAELLASPSRHPKAAVEATNSLFAAAAFSAAAGAAGSTAVATGRRSLADAAPGEAAGAAAGAPPQPPPSQSPHLLPPPPGGKPPTVTVILNVYEREVLPDQLAALLRQTAAARLSEVWVCVFSAPAEAAALRAVRGAGAAAAAAGVRMRVVVSDYNFKFYGRFQVALTAPTDFVWLLDDDMLPGKEHLANLIHAAGTDLLGQSVLGSIGRVLPRPHSDMRLDSYRTWGPHGGLYLPDYYFDMANQERAVPVDYLCSQWFLRPEWLQHMWAERPQTFATGEDFHLSYTLGQFGHLGT